MKRTLHVYLEDILESIEAIEEYTADLSETGFSQSLLVQDAVARRLHIIGEAAKRCRMKSGNDIRPYRGPTLPGCATA